MKSVLIDSSGWIEYFMDGTKANKYAKYIEKARKKNYIIPSIVLYEVYKKIKKEVNEAKATEAIAYMIDATRVVELNERIAVKAAETSLELGLAMADAIIKATADLNNARIITSDQDFKELKNVEVIL